MEINLPSFESLFETLVKLNFYAVAQNVQHIILVSNNSRELIKHIVAYYLRTKYGQVATVKRKKRIEIDGLGEYKFGVSEDDVSDSKRFARYEEAEWFIKMRHFDNSVDKDLLCKILRDDIHNVGQSTELQQQMGLKKTLCIEEINQFSYQCQTMLRKHMEKGIGSYRLLMTTTSYSSILPSLRSRCIRLCVGQLSKDQLHVAKMLNVVTFPDLNKNKDNKLSVDRSYPPLSHSNYGSCWHGETPGLEDLHLNRSAKVASKNVKEQEQERDMSSDYLETCKFVTIHKSYQTEGMQTSKLVEPDICKQIRSLSTSLLRAHTLESGAFDQMLQTSKNTIENIIRSRLTVQAIITKIFDCIVWQLQQETSNIKSTTSPTRMNKQMSINNKIFDQLTHLVVKADLSSLNRSSPETHLNDFVFQIIKIVLKINYSES